MKISKKFRVKNPLGLHLRAAARLIYLLHPFRSNVTIRNEGRHASGRSILNLLSLGAVHDAELEVLVEGEDAGRVLIVLQNFFEDGFRDELSYGAEVVSAEQ